LDDAVVWGAIHAIAVAGAEPTKTIAARLLNRDRAICLDIQHTFPEEIEKQRRLKHLLSKKFKSQIGETVFQDSVNLSIYGEIGADDDRAQKRLMIRMANESLKEISDFKDATIAGAGQQRLFERYYFLDEDAYRIALSAVDSVKGRHA
jgi:hypothetical protein